MRRSAAPSQANSGTKRIKFVAPAPVLKDKNIVADVTYPSQIASRPAVKPTLYKNVITPENSQKNVFNRMTNPHFVTEKCGNESSSNLSSSMTNNYNGVTDTVGDTNNREPKSNMNFSKKGDIPKRDLSAVVSLTKATPTQDYCLDNEILDHGEDKEDSCDNNCQDSSLIRTVASPIAERISYDEPLIMNALENQEHRRPLEEIEINNESMPLVLDNPSPQITNITQKSSDDVGSRYFSVVWCKLSKKKHKKWEGDAVLSTKGRSATLFDMEGKVIGKGTGYKIAQLENLAKDETLMIGGKEIQVMSLLKEDHFKSGKCFSAAGHCTDSLPQSGGPKSKSGTFKPFTNPVKHGVGKLPSQINGIPNSEVNASTPRHDPTAPNALVMPRPSSEHQWRHNKSGLPLLDVVVDPYVASFLRSHQRHGVIFLYECVMGIRDFQGQGAILADDMGLGKTLQCIALIWTLLKQGPYGGKPSVKKILIVTPGSLVTNWFMEFKKWLGQERLNVFAVSGDKKVDEFVKSGRHPVLIISYEMLVRCFETLKDVPFDLIVCDEGHRLKNTAIKTTSMISSLPSRRRIVLTGTPVQNDLQEFYSIVEFCNPGLLGSSGAFKRVYEDPIVLSRQPKATIPQKELGKDRAQELTRLTQMFVLRRTQEINNLYLPPKVELVLFCRPSPLQLAVYKQLISSQVIRRCLSGNLSGAPHLICIGALKEVCNHPNLIFTKALDVEINKNGEDSIYSNLLPLFPPNFDPNTCNTADSGKLEVLSGILTSILQTSSHEKVVLVANHTKTLDILQAFCEAQSYSCLRLDGQTPTAQRQDLVNKFNSRHSVSQRIFLLSSKAGGVGLNLIGASRLILYDIDWNPANDLQAMARVWRDGQKGKVHIYRLLTTGSIEEKIYQRQISKQGLSGAIMDLNNKNNVQFSLDDLKDLFSLNEKTDCETHSMLSCDCEGDPSYCSSSSQMSSPPKDARPCQLGQPSIGGNKLKGKASNLTMAELLQWKHWLGQFGKNTTTWLLDQVGPVLTFLFWHETNAEKSV